MSSKRVKPFFFLLLQKRRSTRISCRVTHQKTDFDVGGFVRNSLAILRETISGPIPEGLPGVPRPHLRGRHISKTVRTLKKDFYGVDILGSFFISSVFWGKVFLGCVHVRGKNKRTNAYPSQSNEKIAKARRHFYSTPKYWWPATVRKWQRFRKLNVSNFWSREI